MVKILPFKRRVPITKEMQQDKVINFRCLACRLRWVDEEPKGMKKVHCPACNSTLLWYR